MHGADAEASELMNYYDTTNKAKQLIHQKVFDEGFGSWEDALRNVEPHVSPTEYNALKQEFDFFYQAMSNMEESDDDADADWTEHQRKNDDMNNYYENVNADADSSTRSGNWPAEHWRLAKRHTMTPRMYDHRMPGRSLTISFMEQRGATQVARTTLKNDHPLLHMPRSDTEINTTPVRTTREEEPMMKGEITRGSEPIANSSISLPNIERPSDDEESVMGNRTQANIPTTPTGLMSSKENDDWFTNLKSRTHEFVYGKKREYWPKQAVKVAILDSGIALTDKVLTKEARSEMKLYNTRILGRKTFTNEFPDPKSPAERVKAWDDLTGHGTTVAYQLMETCPSASVYIAKVTVTESEQKKAVPDREAIAKAIRFAAKPVTDGGWSVDIINMSFGWPDAEVPGSAGPGEGISDAIEYAKKQGVLLFAAASNYGLTVSNPVLYPARDHNVISVDAEDGLGNPASFAKNSERGDGRIRYCAPGLSVNSLVSAEPACGSSFACPVAAGVAALVLEFARHEKVSLSESDTVRSTLSDPRGMARVFEAMSQKSASSPGFRMLYPWLFFNHRDREEVARDIVRQLEIEFGDGKVGHEIIRTITWQKAVQKILSSH
ncbi:peptidase S8/S53 domain-containing protein [Xylaria arbuscula]|nr:peptidase S8/S53 domain-containing protein [Xylaria arbuscula]